MCVTAERLHFLLGSMSLTPKYCFITFVTFQQKQPPTQKQDISLPPNRFHPFVSNMQPDRHTHTNAHTSHAPSLNYCTVHKAITLLWKAGNFLLWQQTALIQRYRSGSLDPGMMFLFFCLFFEWEWKFQESLGKSLCSKQQPEENLNGKKDQRKCVCNRW